MNQLIYRFPPPPQKCKLLCKITMIAVIVTEASFIEVTFQYYEMWGYLIGEKIAPEIEFNTRKISFLEVQSTILKSWASFVSWSSWQSSIAKLSTSIHDEIFPCSHFVGLLRHGTCKFVKETRG